MTYCQPSAHTKQTILRGCCNTGNNCCDNISSYEARNYCGCTNTNGDNIETQSLCSILERAFKDQEFANSAALYSYLASLPFTGVCGPVGIIGLRISTPITLGTVTNGRIVVTNNALSTGQSIVLQSLNPNVPCGSFRILA